MFKEQMKKNTILVIGDFMLDSYWIGNVSRISPEAPVPIFLKKANRSVAGGAANVVANLLAAGKNVVAASVVGKDSVGNELTEMLQNIGCDCSLIQRSEKRKTTKKTRLLAQNNQQLLRVDEEELAWLNNKEEERLVADIKKSINIFSAIILSDYMKGILTESLCRKIIRMARNNSIPVFCDVKDPNAEKYEGATLIKPNQKELGILSGMNVNTEAEIKLACKMIAAKCKNDYVLVTLGSKGMALYTRGQDTFNFVPSQARDVYDVSGAGDTVISYLVACTSSGISIDKAVYYANIAAGIKVGKVGTSTVSLDEMEKDICKEKLLKNTQVKTTSKILDVSGLMKALYDYPNKKIVFTNGCFDILHAGHVMYLQKAAEYGDVLIVGVNSDESIKRLKGPSRPVNKLDDRLTVLSGLQCITFLIPFDEDTPEELIRTIKPNVLVKGADYEGKFVAGADFVKGHGGEVKLIPMLEGRSTTNIIKKNRETDYV